MFKTAQAGIQLERASSARAAVRWSKPACLAK